MDELDAFLDKAEQALEEGATTEGEDTEIAKRSDEQSVVGAGDIVLDERYEAIRSTSREGVTHELHIQERVVGCTCEAYQYSEGACKHIIAAEAANGGDGRYAGDGQ